ncbi:hypothetical protein RND81_14G010800 [Saponaria officinalis]|uniref:C2H2-type domain-containing protein n=1 Tax=Saponaria officinalis TaxID=3572 RepID=A0AAW1GGA8_SAPOF
MDSTDEEFYGSTTSFTTKGRRTKRQRTAAITSTYPENSYGSSTSATPSDDQDVVSEVTTEEQDLANCLILLAQGQQLGQQRRRSSSKIISTNYINKVNISNNSTGVYECKTCNRTFPSFQALGGHRTSHKKTVKPPTLTTPPPPPPKPEEQPRDGGRHDSSSVPPPRKPRNSDKAAARVHECSICGSEFLSGQALGGHMRRHRPAVALPRECPTINGDVDTTSTAEIESGGPRNINNNILSLDLNLPAPSDDHDDHDEVLVVDDDDDDHMVETKFHVIPTPALLDCHY